MITLQGATLRRAMLRSSSLVAVLAILSVTGGSAAEPQRYDFSGYLAEGYRQMADVAERSEGHAAFAAYFEQRRALAVHRRSIRPEALDGRNLDAFTLREATFARRQLVARLDAGARQSQPLLAAIAQVNFDCWVAPLPKQVGVPDGDECRRRFYFAFAGLVPAPPGQLPGAPTPSVPLESVQVASTAPPKVIVNPPVAPAASVSGPTAATTPAPSACAESCVALAFIGPAADELIDKLRSGVQSARAADSGSRDTARQTLGAGTTTSARTTGSPPGGAAAGQGSSAATSGSGAASASGDGASSGSAASAGGSTDGGAGGTAGGSSAGGNSAAPP